MARITITDTGGLTAAEGVATLRAAGHEVAVHEVAQLGDLGAELTSVDALIVGYAKVTAADFAAAPALRVIATTTTGVDQVDMDAANAAGVAVHPLPSPASEEVATHALAGMLALLREIPAAQNVARDSWDFTQIPTPPRISELTLGVCGLGRIARKLVERAYPLFARVVAFDPFVPADQWPDGVDRVADLDALCRVSNVLSLHAPATAENHHMVGERTLGLLPRGAYLVNVARGELVDNAAVVGALDAGQLRGAFLDVLDPEPPAVDEPLLSHPRVIVTPHSAFYSTTTDLAYMAIAVDSVLAALAAG